MKNKFIYLSVILFSALTISSCASRKYGCPNTAGTNVQAIAPTYSAI